MMISNKSYLNPVVFDSIFRLWARKGIFTSSIYEAMKIIRNLFWIKRTRLKHTDITGP